MKRFMVSLLIIAILPAWYVQAGSKVDVTLFIDYHTYINLTSIGAEAEINTGGFIIRLGYEAPSVITMNKWHGDPFSFVPVKSIYSIEVEKPLRGGWFLSYSHYSAHWHLLAQEWYNMDTTNKFGWYGDTQYRIGWRLTK